MLLKICKIYDFLLHVYFSVNGNAVIQSKIIKLKKNEFEPQKRKRNFIGGVRNHPQKKIFHEV
jgi:hypothetical protein